jgi:F-box-like
MSLSSYQPAHQLSDDVLLVIFDQLDDQDLLRCEAVCRQWRNVLLSGTPWRRLYHRQIVSSQQWRNILPIFGVDVEELETVHYRSFCRAIVQELKQVYRNWQTGIFKKTCAITSLKNISLVTIWDDRIALYRHNAWNETVQMTFVHRTSLELISFVKLTSPSFAVTNAKIIVAWGRKIMNILDTNGRLISHVPGLDEYERLTWVLVSCCISGDQVAVFSQTCGQEKLSLWDVSIPTKATGLKSQKSVLGLPFMCESSMKMDDKFIVVLAFQYKTSNFCFFSKKTLALHWQKTVKDEMKHNFAYGKGLLLLYVSKQNVNCEEYGLIQVYDVTSKTCFHEVRITAKYDYDKLEHRVGFNSKFMVVFENPRHHRLRNKMNIYDLEAMKNPKSSADDLLVHSVAVDFNDDKFAVTETEIFIQGREEIRILDFSSFNVFQNEANFVTLSLPWRSVWRSKGVDEEPLEPLYHMEVYREVLKYFEELSNNCQIAIEERLVVDPDIASFALGDEFISYRQLTDLDIYDEEVSEESQKITNKSIQISRNTHGSVMCMRIQLIDVTTGDIINKMKLNIDAIGFHYGGNLLVFVCKIGEDEHLLSVWRLNKSLNFSHIKNVSIGEYIPRVCDESLQIDEHFIVVHVPNEHTVMTFNFISLKTFQVERSLTCYYETSYYDGGYLFLMNSDFLVRILDVASGTFLHDILMEPSSFDYVITRSYSNYVVIATIKNNWCGPSKLHVYDLKCLKENNVVPTHLLLTTIDLECKVKRMTMNETRIVCLSSDVMYVIDLKPIDRLRYPEFCLSSP